MELVSPLDQDCLLFLFRTLEMCHSLCYLPSNVVISSSELFNINASPGSQRLILCYILSGECEVLRAILNLAELWLSVPAVQLLYQDPADGQTVQWTHYVGGRAGTRSSRAAAGTDPCPPGSAGREGTAEPGKSPPCWTHSCCPWQCMTLGQGSLPVSQAQALSCWQTCFLPIRASSL